MLKVKYILLFISNLYFTVSCSENIKVSTCNICNFVIVGSKVCHDAEAHLGCIEFLLSLLKQDAFDQLYQYLLEYNLIYRIPDIEEQITKHNISEFNKRKLKKLTLGYVYRTVRVWFDFYKNQNNDDKNLRAYVRLYRACKKYYNLERALNNNKYSLTKVSSQVMGILLKKNDENNPEAISFFRGELR